MSTVVVSNGYKGYVTPRPFGGYFIPISVQSLILRDYCSRKKYLYNLHSGENNFDNSYLVLEGICESAAKYKAVLMCSFHMLPRNKDRRIEMYKNFLSKNCEIHFILEGIVLDKINKIDEFELIIQLSKIAGENFDHLLANNGVVDDVQTN